MEQYKVEEDQFTTNMNLGIGLEPMNFSITFSYGGKRKTVILNNGEDLLKLADIFSEFLSNNNIPNTIKEETNYDAE